ncbi:MAG: hypothetical protein WCC84_11860 [Candidatus Cybelea sp.]
MELEEIKTLWAQRNRELEASTRLNVLLLRQWNFRAAETAMKRFGRGVWFELIVNAIGLMLIGSFAAGHMRELQFFAPAAAIGVYAIALVIACIRQLVAVAALDYDEPVVAIQKSLERLRIRRIRLTLWTLLFAPLMWLPLLIVALRGVFGVDAYAALSPNWLVSNALFGFALIPSAIFLARRYGSRLAAYTSMRRLADEIAGRSLSSALESLDALRRFESER